VCLPPRQHHTRRLHAENPLRPTLTLLDACYTPGEVDKAQRTAAAELGGDWTAQLFPLHLAPGGEGGVASPTSVSSHSLSLCLATQPPTTLFSQAPTPVTTCALQLNCRGQKISGAFNSAWPSVICTSRQASYSQRALLRPCRASGVEPPRDRALVGP
jgi:hypothetical protein